ncbi:hypothetical protein S83_061939 [Arachis hypogaea]
MPSTHTVEASTFLWSQHDRPSVTTAEGTAEEFISKSTACRAGQRLKSGENREEPKRGRKIDITQSLLSIFLYPPTPGPQ